jgi:hypothetical protein
MKRLYWIAALLPLAAWCAAAQGTPDETRVRLEKLIAQSKMIATEGVLVNGDIKGAPYAADEITQFNQTLGDGTHIQRENKVAVYRDGQGRVRRETPSEITIMDPVAGASYSLNPTTMTGRKMTVSIVSHLDGSTSTMSVMARAPSAGDKAKVEEERFMVVTSEGISPRRVVPVTVDEKIKADQEAAQAKLGGVFNYAVSGNQAGFAVGGGVTFKATSATLAAGEPIGQQMVEGVLCDGTRSTETIAAGAIGNDKPIQTVNEHWYSSELKTTVRTMRTDPRNGDETFRLTNIRRGEPGPDLFQVPAGYQIAGN